MSEPKYTAAEQRERMADFEREVKKARACWRSGKAYVILSITEYFALKALAVRGISPATTTDESKCAQRVLGVSHARTDV